MKMTWEITYSNLYGVDDVLDSRRQWYDDDHDACDACDDSIVAVIVMMMGRTSKQVS